MKVKKVDILLVETVFHMREDSSRRDGFFSMDSNNVSRARREMGEISFEKRRRRIGRSIESIEKPYE